jgi:hypothetical protein
VGVGSYNMMVATILMGCVDKNYKSRYLIIIINQMIILLALGSRATALVKSQDLVPKD